MKGAALALAVLGIGGAPAVLPQRSDVDMVGIPGGVFEMGSATGRDDERPVHGVRISAFSLSRTAVTVGQFRAFVDASGYRTEAERSGGCVVFTGRGWDTRRDADWRDPGFSQGDDHPVTCVSWNDSQAFIRWLNARTGRRYRLPTEAEWEYAARGGQGGYCDGNLDSAAWFDGNSGNSTHPVGRKRPNAYGLYDMIGNVWEWCADWYGGYPSSPQTDPTGPGDGSSRINRGGAWYGAARGCWRRGKNTPDDRGNGLGFRLAADAPSGLSGRAGPSGMD
jgi:formylglycine-generating enzyme required for sulfatase activity